VLQEAASQELTVTSGDRRSVEEDKNKREEPERQKQLASTGSNS
jgi:hypothetical protein